MARRRGGGQGPGNPYGVLVGLGVALLILIAGVLYFGLAGQPRRSPAGPGRTAIWLAQPERPAAERRDMILLLEEDRNAGGLTVLVLPSRLQLPTAALTLQPAPGGGRQARDTLQEAIGYRVDQHAVIGTATMERLVNMTGGLTVDGKLLDGAGAVGYLFGEADVNRRMERAPRLLLGVMAAAAEGKFQGGLRDLLALAGGVETDISLLDLPALFGRWSGYGPRVVPAPGQAGAGDAWQLDLAGLRGILHPDPPGVR